MTPAELRALVAAGDTLSNMSQAFNALPALLERLDADKLALERARSCITGLLKRTPVRDVAETLAEIDAAIAAQGEK